MNLFDDIRDEKGRLKAHKTNGDAQSIAGKYARGTRDVDGAPVEDVHLELSRTLPPDQKYEYGVDKRPLPKLTGPYMLEAPKMPNYGEHRPVWRGWRPVRPPSSYPDVGAEMMVPDRTYKIEASIPTQSEVIDMAARNSLSPYPMVHQDAMIPDPYREYGMFQKGQMSGYYGMGDLPTGTTASLPPSGIGLDVGGIAQDLAAGYQAQYEARAKEAQGIAMGLPAKPSAPFPWTTLLTVAGIGLAAAFILPKVLK